MWRQGDARDLVNPVCPSLARRRDGCQPLREAASPPLRLFLYPLTQAANECDWFDRRVGLKEEDYSFDNTRIGPTRLQRGKSHVCKSYEKLPELSLRLMYALHIILDKTYRTVDSALHG